MMEGQINQTIDQLVFSLIFQKYMKHDFRVNYTITLIKIFFENTNVAFVKALVLDMPFSHNKSARERKEFCAAILIDLIKAFYRTCYDILIAKIIDPWI